MRKVLICLFILVNLSFAANAQRSFPRRHINQTHPVLRHGVRIFRHPLRLRNQRQNRIKQERIQLDTLHLKSIR